VGGRFARKCGRGQQSESSQYAAEWHGQSGPLLGFEPYVVARANILLIDSWPRENRARPEKTGQNGARFKSK
jgi:hypothetical protein